MGLQALQRAFDERRVQQVADIFGNVQRGVALQFGHALQGLARAVGGDDFVVGAVEQMQRRLARCGQRRLGQATAEGQHAAGQAVMLQRQRQREDGAL